MLNIRNRRDLARDLALCLDFPLPCATILPPNHKKEEEEMKTVERIAFLGPEWSFSHDLVRKRFPDSACVPCESLSSVVKSVVVGDCALGIVPFYNTNYQSVRETQIEIVGNRGKVHVVDVFALPVVHYLAGYGRIQDVRTVRTKSVVFEQASKWLARELPSVVKDEVASTSAAVQSLSVGAPDVSVAAIGTKSACKAYKVPVIARRIQNAGNMTVFFLVAKEAPRPVDCKRVLMCLRKATNEDEELIETVVKECYCSMRANWKVMLKDSKGDLAFFFELDGDHSRLGLNTAVKKIADRAKGVFMVGGYQESISRLMN